MHKYTVFIDNYDNSYQIKALKDIQIDIICNQENKIDKFAKNHTTNNTVLYIYSQLEGIIQIINKNYSHIIHRLFNFYRSNNFQLMSSFHIFW